MLMKSRCMLCIQIAQRCLTDDHRACLRIWVWITVYLCQAISCLSSNICLWCCACVYKRRKVPVKALCQNPLSKQSICAGYRINIHQSFFLLISKTAPGSSVCYWAQVTLCVVFYLVLQFLPTSQMMRWTVYAKLPQVWISVWICVCCPIFTFSVPGICSGSRPHRLGSCSHKRWMNEWCISLINSLLHY